MNSYPTIRGFTAIGTGGDDFVQSMVVAVESVLQQPIPEVISVLVCSNQSIDLGMAYTKWLPMMTADIIWFSHL